MAEIQDMESITPELTRAERRHSIYNARKHLEKNAIEASG